MKVVEQGRWREARGYLWHCRAVFHPGMTVPVFEEPRYFRGELEGITGDEAGLIIDEGRRQVDRQSGTLEHLRTNAGVLLTLGLAEVAFLVNGAQASFRAWPAAILWCLSAASVVLGLLGVLGVLTAEAELGSTDTLDLAEATRPRRTELARQYAERCRIGASTVNARITVIRDATVFLVLGGILYAAAWPFQG